MPSGYCHEGAKRRESFLKFPTFMAAVQTHLIVFNQEVSGHVEDHCVESIRVQGQSVVIVKAVDVHLGQTHFIVGVNSGGVEEVAGARRNQF